MKTCTLNNGVEMPLLGFLALIKPLGTKCARSVETASSAAIGSSIPLPFTKMKTRWRGHPQSGVNRQEIFLATKISFKDYEHTV